MKLLLNSRNGKRKVESSYCLSLFLALIVFAASYRHQEAHEASETDRKALSRGVTCIFVSVDRGKPVFVAMCDDCTHSYSLLQHIIFEIVILGSIMLNCITIAVEISLPAGTTNVFVIIGAHHQVHPCQCEQHPHRYLFCVHLRH